MWGPVIWTESWAFENCPVAFCYWSALTSSSLALELFFLWQPLVLRERKPLLQSFRPLLSLATNHCSRAREKETYIPQPPRGQVVVAKSLVCPRGRVTRISIGRYIEAIVLEPMFFHFIHVSTSGKQLKEFGSHWRLESGIQVPLTKNQESSTWFPESTTWNSESKTVLLIFHWLSFLKRINQLKTRAVSGPQLWDTAGI